MVGPPPPPVPAPHSRRPRAVCLPPPFVALSTFCPFVSAFHSLDCLLVYPGPPAPTQAQPPPRLARRSSDSPVRSLRHSLRFACIARRHIISGPFALLYFLFLGCVSRTPCSSSSTPSSSPLVFAEALALYSPRSVLFTPCSSSIFAPLPRSQSSISIGHSSYSLAGFLPCQRSGYRPQALYRRQARPSYPLGSPLAPFRTLLFPSLLCRFPVSRCRYAPMAHNLFCWWLVHPPTLRPLPPRFCPLAVRLLRPFSLAFRLTSPPFAAVFSASRWSSTPSRRTCSFLAFRFTPSQFVPSPAVAFGFCASFVRSLFFRLLVCSGSCSFSCRRFSCSAFFPFLRRLFHRS